jgi:hypothetical protein
VLPDRHRSEVRLVTRYETRACFASQAFATARRGFRQRFCSTSPSSSFTASCSCCLSARGLVLKWHPVIATTTRRASESTECQAKLSGCGITQPSLACPSRVSRDSAFQRSTPPLFTRTRPRRLAVLTTPGPQACWLDDGRGTGPPSHRVSDLGVEQLGV